MAGRKAVQGHHLQGQKLGRDFCVPGLGGDRVDAGLLWGELGPLNFFQQPMVTHERTALGAKAVGQTALLVKCQQLNPVNDSAALHCRYVNKGTTVPVPHPALPGETAFRPLGQCLVADSHLFGHRRNKLTDQEASDGNQQGRLQRGCRQLQQGPTSGLSNG